MLITEYFFYEMKPYSLEAFSKIHVLDSNKWACG